MASAQEAARNSIANAFGGPKGKAEPSPNPMERRYEGKKTLDEARSANEFNPETMKKREAAEAATRRYEEEQAKAKNGK